MKCKICANEEGNKIYYIKERRKNEGDYFKYLWCSNCGTLQLIDVIDNSAWYGNEYYSFNINASFAYSVKREIRHLLCATLPRMKVNGGVKNYLWRRFPWIMYFSGTNIDFDSRILDVGCGNGAGVYRLVTAGFKNAIGIDAYCEETYYPIEFMKCDIFSKSLKSFDQSFDFIMFHHSFEHMNNPDGVLNRVSEIMSSGGICIIRIPVCGGHIWDEYKENWWQIDPPLHYFLYSEKSMRILAERNGLELYNVVYDSEPRQILMSQQFRDTDKSYQECIENINKVNKSKMSDYWKECEILNNNKKGDQAVFYLRKSL